MADAFGQARTTFVAPNDQPWSQPFRLWRDAAKTQPYAVLAVGGKLQWPGGTSQVDLAPTLTANVITPALTAETLASMRSGTWWGELQFLLDGTTAGQLRFDLKVQPGYGSGLGATQSLGMTCDVVVIDGAADVFMLDAGPIGPTGPPPWAEPEVWATDTDYSPIPPASLVTVENGVFVCLAAHTSTVFASDLTAGYWRQIVSASAAGAAISPALQALIQQRLNVSVTNAEDAIRALLTFITGGDGSLDFTDPANSGLIGH